MDFLDRNICRRTQTLATGVVRPTPRLLHVTIVGPHHASLHDHLVLPLHVQCVVTLRSSLSSLERGRA